MRRSFGFTLVELLVVSSIISILAGVGFFYAQETSQKSRDQKRQSDLRLLQAAVEQFKIDNGYYPAGCNGAGQWSGELGGTAQCSGGNTQYIVGLAPAYIPVLPRDPKRDTGEVGYAYLSNRDAANNTGGTVYKIVARGTVESETVDYFHPMKSCDITPSGGSLPSVQNSAIEGLCSRLPGSGNNVFYPHSQGGHACNVNNTQPNGFPSTYGVWGGFAPIVRFSRTVAGQQICSDYLGITANPLDEFIDCNSNAILDNLNRNANNVRTALGIIRAQAFANTTSIICN